MKKQTLFEIMAIILIAIFCISITPKTLENDTFYTIKIGEHILESGKIDMIDPFSWHEDLEYSYPHWLYDITIYLIYNLGGMTGIYISTCIFSIILGVTLYKVGSRLVNNKVVTFAITIGAIYMLSSYITARAQLVTFILFALQIFFMEKLINTSEKRYGIGLIIISILIANVHVAVWPFMFVLYLPYIAEYIVAILQEKRNGKEEKQGYKIIIQKKAGIKYLILVMLICILTGTLTPLGLSTPYTYLIKTLQGTTTQNIEEHLPMVLINYIDVISVIVIFLIILIFTDAKIKLSDLFMLCGLTFLMFYSKRQLTMFVIMGTIILNRTLYNWMEKCEKDIDNKLINIFTTKLGTVILISMVLIMCLYLIEPHINTTYIDENKYPVEMSNFILQYFEDNNINLNDVRLYNEYDYGSYLLFRDIPVFIDSRCDLYTPEYNGGRDIFMDFVDSLYLNIWFEETLKKYDITHMIVYVNSNINKIIENTELDGYKLLKKDDNFVFYEVNL